MPIRSEDCREAVMNRVRTFILFFFTLSEFRWWLWRAKTQLLYDEVEQYHLRALVIQVLQVFGLGALSMYLGLVGFTSQVAPLPGIEGGETITITARTPGPDYDTAAF